MLLAFLVCAVSAQKVCFVCEYRSVKPLETQNWQAALFFSYVVAEGAENTTLSGTPNCLMNLVAQDPKISVETSSDNDLCFTQVTQTFTNDSDIISLKREVSVLINFSIIKLIIVSIISDEIRTKRNLLQSKKWDYKIPSLRKFNSWNSAMYNKLVQYIWIELWTRWVSRRPWNLIIFRSDSVLN